MEHEVTIGELYRLLEKLDGKVDAIVEQTTKTNGSVGRHDERLHTLEREIDGLRSTLGRVVFSLIIGLPISVVAGVIVSWLK